MHFADSGPLRTDLCPYRRPFLRPLVAAWGKWAVREGTLVRVLNREDGHPGFGEIAPLPGSRKPSGETSSTDLQTPEGAFARWSAIACAQETTEDEGVPSAGLLALTDATYDEIEKTREEGFRTWKLKLGAGPVEGEWQRLKSVASRLKEAENLRLDANQGWSWNDWQFWKPRLADLADGVEYLEEPFPPETPPETWFREAGNTPLALALDETLDPRSLTSWVRKGWPGFFILKPSLMGNPEEWLARIMPAADRVVLSSVFETGIGLTALLHLARLFPKRDHGLGTVRFFHDDLGTRVEGNRLFTLSRKEQESLWNRLSTV